MSENTNSVNQDGSFDVFDLGGSTPVADPFAGAGNTQPQLDVVKTPAAAQTEQTAEEKNETASDEAEHEQQADDNQAEQASTNPLVAGAAKAEEKQAVVTAESLFAKAPVFEYGGASEDITDASKTFEELRIEKASDFPELEDGKRVSWSMEYGKIVKSVATPNKTTIGKMKSEIENSKEFIEALKKAKDKNLVCKVKPKITAQSKGIASYKGVYPTVEEAEASGKPICILPARNGHVYEMRRNEVGTFIARAKNVRELSEISAGFIPALPPVPFVIFAQIIAFFRHFMKDGHDAEALVHVYWDKTEQRYKIVPPMQNVSKAHISVIVPPDEALEEERYLHVADIHSHNSMPAFFSKIDDCDEKATRVYVVVGCLDQTMPAISARVSVGGRFVPIDARQVVEIPSMITPSPMPDDDLSQRNLGQRFKLTDSRDFPIEWIASVNVSEPPCCKMNPVDVKLPDRGFSRLFRILGGWSA